MTTFALDVPASVAPVDEIAHGGETLKLARPTIEFVHEGLTNSRKHANSSRADEKGATEGSTWHASSSPVRPAGWAGQPLRPCSATGTR
jgi:hypothetical protein